MTLLARFPIACVAIAASLFAADAAAQDARAVPTYESAGLYWSNPGATVATGCAVRFRKVGDAAWTPGLAMWLDTRNSECRGSLVHLAPGTAYQAELSLPGQPAAHTLAFTTWATQKPVAQTIAVPSGSATLAVTQGGSPGGYVVYQGAPGAVLDAGNVAQYNVTINASHVIVRGLTLRDARQDAIRIAVGVTDVVIEDNDISGWGRQRTGIYGTDLDSGVRAVCTSASLDTRFTIQRNRIHDPRYTANSWSIGHPTGPQAVTLSYCGGNNVIRHNEMYSSTGRYFNDIIGGEDNASTTGFPNADSDIHGNRLSHAWDDAIEAEGGNRNVRIWGNYLDQTGTGIASTITSIGPLYIFRNVYNRSRMLEATPHDSDDRQVFFKAGSNAAFGDGRRYVFHNTMLQATQVGSIYGLGASGGISGTGSTKLVNNTVSRNNIFHNWRTWTAYYDVGTGNDFANDMYNGNAGAPDSGGIRATPIYAPGHGWTSEAGGQYQLLFGTPGYDAGAAIPNFNNAFNGAAPDVGAHEGGTAPMLFGLAASPGPAGASGPPAQALALPPDFDGNDRGDLLLAHLDGRAAIWLMNGVAPSATAEIIGAVTGWSVVALGEFNADGKSDLVWRHADGRMAIYLMNGTAPSATQQLLNAGPWTVTHTPDLNGDGRSDLLFHNLDGSVAVWTMNGTTMTAGSSIIAAGSGFRVIRTADFNGDGRDDLLWKHADGRHAIWLMNGVAPTSTTQVVNAGGWTATHTPDLDGDGRADIVWQHADGSVAAWLMNGTTMASGSGLSGAGSGWRVALAGDFDGNGRDDLLWQHADGRAAVYVMNGLVPAQTTQILNAGGWRARRLADFNADGRADIAWQHLDGSVAVWLMNGATMASGSGLLGPGVGWGVIPLGDN